MWDVKPGDLVVCVNNGPLPDQVGRSFRQTVVDAGLRQGQIYTVRQVGSNPNDRRLKLWLEELKRPILSGCEALGEVGFCADRFRPVSKQSSELFRQLVTNPQLQDANI